MIEPVAGTAQIVLRDSPVGNPRIRPFLLGVAAGVIGLIAAVTLEIVDESVVDVPTAVLAAAAFVVLYRFQAKLPSCSSYSAADS